MRVLQGGEWIEMELDLTVRQPSPQPRIAVMGPIVEQISRKTGHDSVTVHEILMVWFRPPRKERVT